MQNLFDIFKLGGPFMWIILFLSILAFALIITLIIKFFFLSIEFKKFLKYFYNSFVEDEKKKIFDNNKNNYFFQLFKKAVEKNFRTKEELDKFLNFNIENYLQKIIRGIDIISGIGNISPLVGFLGTVFGMIIAFQSIANSNNISAKIVAEGIYQALLTTCFGLIVAIPCFVVDTVFNHFLQNLINNIEEKSEEFIENYNNIVDKIIKINK